jgi:histidinol-phosphatase
VAIALVVVTLSSDLELAHELADAADAISMAYFERGEFEHQMKPDGSPVTVADRDIEERLRSLIRERRPDDGFLGEEVGSSGPSQRRWIVDGIDGTVVFVAGYPGWATEIALEEQGQVVLGVSTSPALGRRWWAGLGDGAWVATLKRGRRDRPEPLGVSTRTSLEGARCSFIPPLDALEGDRLAVAERLIAHCTYVPPIGHGAAMVAAGDIDLCLQLAGGPWDFAALAVIVEEAGGRFSDLEGRGRLDGGGPVLFTNMSLQTAALEALTGS